MLTRHIESFLLQWRQGQREVILNTKDFKTRRVRGLFSTVNCIPWHYWTNPGTGRFSWMFDYNYFLFNLNSFSLVQVLNMAVNTHFSVLVLCVLFFFTKNTSFAILHHFLWTACFWPISIQKTQFKEIQTQKSQFFSPYFMQLYFSDHFGTSLYSLGLIVVSEKKSEVPRHENRQFFEKRPYEKPFLENSI